MNAPRTDDANQRLLRRFLSRYTNLKKVIKRLEERADEIKEDFNCSPFRAVKQGEGGHISGASTVPPYVLAINEVELEIMRTRSAAASALSEIVHVLDLLDQDSLKYIALTARYIDGWGEEQICDYIPCAPRTYYYLITDGIDELLAIPEVHALVCRYAIEVTKIPPK